MTMGPRLQAAMEKEFETSQFSCFGIWLVECRQILPIILR